MPSTCLTTHSTNVESPPLYRFADATCQLCGRESAWCALVRIREGYGFGRWSRPTMACACCREANVKRWAVAAGWHVGVVVPIEAAMRPKDWEQWVADNPPLELDEKGDDHADKEIG